MLRVAVLPALSAKPKPDPADPPANVANARRELPNSLTVILPGQGHGQLGRGCVPTLIARFIAAGSVRGLDVSCAHRVPPPAFDLRN